MLEEHGLAVVGAPRNVSIRPDQPAILIGLSLDVTVSLKWLFQYATSWVTVLLIDTMLPDGTRSRST